MTGAILCQDIIPDGDLTLVMVSDEAWQAHEALKEAYAEGQGAEMCRFSEVAASRRATGDEASKQWAAVRSCPALTDPPPDRPAGDIRILVEAKHLTRVSKPFRLFLDPKTVEGKAYLRDGRVELRLDEDDPEAMCHLMNCIFGKMSQVPGFLSDIEVAFDTFVQACVLVDKYDLHEAAGLLLEHWWTIFATRRPNTVTPDFFKWLSVVHVLRKDKVLQMMLKDYMQHGTKIDNPEYLPLPDALTRADVRRIHAIADVNRFLEKLHNSASGTSETTVCSCQDLSIARKCDAEILVVMYQRLTRRRVIQKPGFVYSTAPDGGGNSSKALRHYQPIRVQHNHCSFNSLFKTFKRFKISHPCVQLVADRKKEERDKAKKGQSQQRQQSSASDWSNGASVGSGMQLGFFDPTSPLAAVSYNSLLQQVPSMTTPGIPLDDYSLRIFDEFRFDDYLDPSGWDMSLLDDPSDYFASVTQQSRAGFTPTLPVPAEPLTCCAGPRTVLMNTLHEIEKNMLNPSAPMQVIKID